ncbi:MAG: type II toxin-antitoxin system RelE/ParE family toxin [Chloroflexi bacterium]|nr:type II toxin-antitoxin system RelE/ParE family toxin [Chloroflexota bacterium]
MTWAVRLTPKAVKQLSKLDVVARSRIERFLKEDLDREDPRSSGRSLVGEPFWRYRVGDHRILVSLEDEVLTVLVVEVAHRRTVYRDL